jgi:hypothetical protein
MNNSVIAVENCGVQAAGWTLLGRVAGHVPNQQIPAGARESLSQWPADEPYSVIASKELGTGPWQYCVFPLDWIHNSQSGPVGDRLRACGSYRNQAAYPHKGMSRLRKKSGGHMSWTRGKRCSSKGGIAWELYRHKTAVFSEPSTAAPPKRLTLSGISCAASTPCRVTSGWSI